MKRLSGGCTLDCFDCCKFNVYVEDEKVVKVWGRNPAKQADTYIQIKPGEELLYSSMTNPLSYIYRKGSRA